MISIFTPSHDHRFLPQVYESIKDQPFDEWVILQNQGSVSWKFDDPRVKNVFDKTTPPLVGALKAEAVKHAKGDILLELDHDDMLAPTAVEEVRKAFEDPSVGFVYSNAIRVDEQWKPWVPEDVWAPSGWEFRDCEFAGHKLREAISFEPTPAAVGKIWFAPDHLRAFRRSAYEAAGGYNPALRVLDDQDLMSRLYQVTQFHHIDRPLYLYRIHGENAWLKHNAEIQEGVWKLYDQYAEKLALVWARRAGLRTLDLGGAIASPEDYETVDRANADICCDLNVRWPFEDSSVGVVRAFDIFEHLRDPLHTMKELSRVLVPGGWAFIQVPSTDGRGAFQDPTHVSFWNQNSFLYYTHVNWARYIGIPVRFQASRLYTTAKNAMEVCWVRADLVNLKGGYRPPGIIEI